MIKVGWKAAKGGAKAASRQLDKEQRTWHRLFGEAYRFLRRDGIGAVRALVELVPRSLVLLLRIAKSPDTDAKLKVTIVGTIILATFLLGVRVSGVSWITLFGLGMMIGGPFTAVGMAMAHDVVVAVALVILVLTACGLCITAIGSDQIRLLAIELWGEDQGSSFFESVASAYSRFSSVLEPLSRRLESVLRYVGRRAERRGRRPDLESAVSAAEEAAKKLDSKLGKKDRKRQKP